MKLSSSHTSSGAPGGCQTSPVITLTMAPMTHLPSCESAPSTTHCSVQRPAEQARPTAAGGSQALPVPAALTAATTQADLSRDPKRSNPGPGICSRSLYSLLRHRRRRSGMHLATGSRPPPACPRQFLWQCPNHCLSLKPPGEVTCACVCVCESECVCMCLCDSGICHKHPMSHPLPDQHTVETASGCTKAQEKSLWARSRLYVFRKLVTFNINTHTQPQAKTQQV